jgi:RNA polymerase sigma factor (sigma-70 family)
VDPNTDQKTPMPTGPVHNFLSQVRAAELRRELRADGDLLTAYLQTRDEAALAALVQRHAPMVWGVCRRILRRQHDAEDAFQAAFLVLVQKAAGISDRAAVASWLYGVARQTAVRVRANAMKTTRRERQGPVADPPASESKGDNELRDLIDAEVVALPDKYRAVVVLCDLEERPRSEVAERLGVPEGTVAGRLARAREMLRKRFVRRGLALPGGVVGTLAVQSSVTASAPAAVVAGTVTAAGLAAAGHFVAGAASPQAMAVAKAILKAMVLTKVKVAALVAVVGVVCGASGLAAYRGLGGGESPSAAPAAADDGKTSAAGKPGAQVNGPTTGDGKLPDEDDKPQGKDDGDEDDKPKKKD